MTRKNDGTDDADDVPSPCRNKCKIVLLHIDPVCEGCGRTLEDIVAWRYLDAEAKRTVIEKAKTRLDAST